MKKTIVWTATFLIMISASVRAGINSDSVTVFGSVGKPDDWTAARLKAELSSQIKPVQYTSHGKQHMSDAVPLVELLKASGVSTQLKPDSKADPKSKHLELRLVVVVTGRDGYMVTFSLSELLGDLGNSSVWLAFNADAQPLSDTEGPMKLIVPEDKKPARWVHAVQSISVIEMKPPTTEPAK